MSTSTPPPRAGLSPGRRMRARGRLIRRVVLFVACLLLADALIGERSLLELLRAHRTQAELADAIERAQQENRALREEARRLREDPRTLEALARQELGLIRPGEILFIITDTDAER